MGRACYSGSYSGQPANCVLANKIRAPCPTRGHSTFPTILTRLMTLNVPVKTQADLVMKIYLSKQNAGDSTAPGRRSGDGIYVGVFLIAHANVLLLKIHFGPSRTTMFMSQMHPAASHAQKRQTVSSQLETEAKNCCCCARPSTRFHEINSAKFTLHFAEERGSTPNCKGRRATLIFYTILPLISFCWQAEIAACSALYDRQGTTSYADIA